MSTPVRRAFGGFVMDGRQRRLLRADGTEVPLTPRLYEALALFVHSRGELLEKDELMRALWPGLVVEENNLSQVVLALRRVLDDGQGEDRRFIQTVPRRGYRFVADVRVLPEPVPDGSPPAEAPGGVPASRRRWLSIALSASAAAGMAGAGWGAWNWAARPAAGSSVQSLAVLPFTALSVEGRDDLLELGMADSIAARLSTVPGLVVRSTHSVVRLKGRSGTRRGPLTNWG